MNIEEHICLMKCPRDVLQTVLNFLPADDLGNARLTCKELAETGREPSLPGWRESLQKKIYQTASPELIIKCIERAADRRVLSYADGLELPHKGMSVKHLEQMCGAFGRLALV